MKPRRARRWLSMLAVVSVATCYAFLGAGCIETVLATIGATFF